MYLDEAGTHLGMSRGYARSPGGARAYSKRPRNYGGNISLVGSIRLGEKPILYPFDGAVDGDRFLFFLDRLSTQLSEGDVVIMDNCRIHHIAAVKEKLSMVGAKPLFLPPYSPELNPIEEAWSCIKNVFKSLEARSISAYIEALNLAKSLVTFEKIQAYFTHADSFLNEKRGLLT